MKQSLRRLGMLAAALSIAGLLPAAANANSGYMDTFNTKYGTTGTRLDNCSTCHRSTVPDLNVYGRAFRAKLLTGLTANQALTAIHPLDSDRDTFTNLREIRARTFPGRKASHP